EGTPRRCGYAEEDRGKTADLREEADRREEQIAEQGPKEKVIQRRRHELFAEARRTCQGQKSKRKIAPRLIPHLSSAPICVQSIASVAAVRSGVFRSTGQNKQRGQR